ncbi:MAG: hypothetical protein AB7L66_20535 [Gemmatimonadales bacterium]
MTARRKPAAATGSLAELLELERRLAALLAEARAAADADLAEAARRQEQDAARQAAELAAHAAGETRAVEAELARRRGEIEAATALALATLDRRAGTDTAPLAEWVVTAVLAPRQGGAR